VPFGFGMIFPKLPLAKVSNGVKLGRSARLPHNPRIGI
jgi:hypothetical protein